jgi:hypothetical protein
VAVGDTPDDELQARLDSVMAVLIVTTHGWFCRAHRYASSDGSDIDCHIYAKAASGEHCDGTWDTHAVTVALKDRFRGAAHDAPWR